MMNQEFVVHLIELRKRLIYILIGFLLVFAALFHFANEIYAVLANPLLTYLPRGTQLIATDVTSPFFVPLKLTAITAILFSLPNTVYQIWRFIVPALYQHERKLMLISIFCIIVLFISGMLFCYYIVLPALFSFIGRIKSQEITMLTDVSKYLDLVMDLFLVFGITFQTPVIIFLLIYFNIVQHSKLAGLRKYVFVACFIIAAIVTPPDVLSQTLLAIPLYLLYELGMLVAKLSLNTSIKRQC